MKTPMVCKVGGALLDNPEILKQWLASIKHIQRHRPVIIVHGGGNGVESLLAQLGQKSEKYQGLRVTPDEQMPYIAGALAGTANKQLCAFAYAGGLNAVGLSLFDGDSVTCAELNPALQAVGSAKPNNPALLNSLLEQSFLPVISSIGCDASGRLLNVNADQAATAIAQLLGADLYLLSDVPAVLDEVKRPLKSLPPTIAQILIDSGIIEGGMLVKVKAAQVAANTINKSVFIGAWNEPKALFAHATQQQSSFGTAVQPAAQQTEETLP